MATNDINLKDGERAQRKQLITVAEWTEGGSNTPVREILGVRTEDSAIEFNPDIETSTDILGHTYSDLNKTEPQQSFDPHYVRGGSKLAEYLTKASLKNDIQAYNGKFTMYIISSYMGAEGSYYAVKHKECSIIPQSLGGSNYVNLPIEVHFSNNLEEGAVDKIADDFVFTPSTASGSAVQASAASESAQSLNIKKSTAAV